MKTLVVLILILALLACIFCGVWYFTDGFGGNLAAFGVKYGENTYFTPQSGLAVGSGAKFEIVNPAGKDYKVRITSIGDTNFKFTIGKEPYQWSDMLGWDFTKGFTVTKSASAFTLEYESLAEIIGKVAGQEVTLTDTVSGDLFMLEVTANGSSLRLGFGLFSMTANTYAIYF